MRCKRITSFVVAVTMIGLVALAPSARAVQPDKVEYAQGQIEQEMEMNQVEGQVENVEQEANADQAQGKPKKKKKGTGQSYQSVSSEGQQRDSQSNQIEIIEVGSANEEISFAPVEQNNNQHNVEEVEIQVNMGNDEEAVIEELLKELEEVGQHFYPNFLSSRNQGGEDDFRQALRDKLTTSSNLMKIQQTVSKIKRSIRDKKSIIGLSEGLKAGVCLLGFAGVGVCFLEILVIPIFVPLMAALPGLKKSTCPDDTVDIGHYACATKDGVLGLPIPQGSNSHLFTCNNGDNLIGDNYSQQAYCYDPSTTLVTAGTFEVVHSHKWIAHFEAGMGSGLAAPVVIGGGLFLLAGVLAVAAIICDKMDKSNHMKHLQQIRDLFPGVFPEPS